MTLNHLVLESESADQALQGSTSRDILPNARGRDIRRRCTGRSQHPQRLFLGGDDPIPFLRQLLRTLPPDAFPFNLNVRGRELLFQFPDPLGEVVGRPDLFTGRPVLFVDGVGWGWAVGGEPCGE